MTYLKTAEVAVILRETRANVSRRCKRGEIEATRVGRNWRISQAALDAFLAPEPTPAAPKAEPVYRSADHKRRALAHAS